MCSLKSCGQHIATFMQRAIEGLLDHSPPSTWLSERNTATFIIDMAIDALQVLIGDAVLVIYISLLS